jgi:molybdate transport system substrate-binding protein
MAAPLRMMCALVVRTPFDQVVVPTFEAHEGAVEITWSPSTVIMKNLADGQTTDILLVLSDSMDKLVAQGIVDPATRVDVVTSTLGVAVLAGTPHPDISTAEAFRKTLLAARSVAYSRGGASGIYFKQMIEKLGIAEEINARATIIPEGFTAEMLITGQADLAVQQHSELLTVSGIDIIGSFPDALQNTVMASAAVMQGTQNAERAKRFLAALHTQAADAAYRRNGLTPCQAV